MRFTAQSFVFVALVCLIGVLEQWMADGGFTIWRIALGLFVLGLVYEWFWISRLDLSLRIEGPLSFYLGRDETLRFSIHNPGPRDLQVEYVAGLPPMLESGSDRRECRIAGGAELAQVLPVRGTDVGPVDWSSLPTRVKGPLGLAWWRRALPVEASIAVVPDLLGERHVVPVNANLGDTAVQAGSGMELHHLRDYVPGDPLRAINWKATARSHRLISQVLSEEQHLEVMLVLDLGRTSGVRVDGMTQFSHYLNLAANFARYSLSTGDYVGLLAIADRPLVALPPAKGTQAVTRIHSALRRLAPAAVETDVLAGALEAQRLVRNRSLILFVTDLYGQSTSGDFGRALALWQRRHLTMVVSLLGEEVSQMIPRRAAGLDDVYASLAATEYYEAVSANAAAARRMGAQTVIARPDELQGKVMAQYQALKAMQRV